MCEKEWEKLATLVDLAQLWKWGQPEQPSLPQPHVRTTPHMCTAPRRWEHPEMMLLVRVGDFYEAFGVDALMLRIGRLQARLDLHLAWYVAPRLAPASRVL